MSFDGQKDFEYALFSFFFFIGSIRAVYSDLSGEGTPSSLYGVAGSQVSDGHYFCAFLKHKSGHLLDNGKKKKKKKRKPALEEAKR